MTKKKPTSAYSSATPAERFKISAIAIERLRKRQGSGEFEWAAFATLREQVAQEQLRPLNKFQRLVVGFCDRLEQGIAALRKSVLKR